MAGNSASRQCPIPRKSERPGVASKIVIFDGSSSEMTVRISSAPGLARPGAERLVQLVAQDDLLFASEADLRVEPLGVFGHRRDSQKRRR
jgi:hypothetical protein